MSACRLFGFRKATRQGGDFECGSSRRSGPQSELGPGAGQSHADETAQDSGHKKDHQHDEPELYGHSEDAEQSPEEGRHKEQQHEPDDDGGNDVHAIPPLHRPHSSAPGLLIALNAQRAQWLRETCGRRRLSGPGRSFSSRRRRQV